MARKFQIQSRDRHPSQPGITSLYFRFEDSRGTFLGSKGTVKVKEGIEEEENLEATRKIADGEYIDENNDGF